MSKFEQRHKRTRRDHKSETAEDYVEAVADLIADQGTCRVVDLAKFFAVSHVTVSKIISRLKSEGLLTSQRYGPIELTPTGTELAQQSRQRHEIVVAFLITLGVRPEVAQIDAEGMEHHVSQETLEVFHRFVTKNRPQNTLDPLKTSPDENPIQ